MPPITGVGDVKIALRIEADAHGTIQLSAFGGATVAAQTWLPRAGGEVGRARLQILATDLVSAGFRETECIRRLKRESGGLMQVRRWS